MKPITVLSRTLGFAFAIVLSTASGANAGQSSSRADMVLADIPKATWIAEGDGGRVIYIFFDPNCPSCALLYRTLRPMIEPQDLQVRWIPVAVVNVTSFGKAAAILQAKDPLAGLRHNEEGYRGETYSGGIEEDLPTPATERTLRANEHLLNSLDIPVVPSILFAGKDGRTVLIQGALSPLALRKVFAHLP